uniref:Uncharacterized protein n=1 Tax=Solanum tuberosum TaxID=4113 RepID=M1DYS4_SOLTU
MLARLGALESGNVAVEPQLLDDDDDEASIDDEQHMQLNFQLDSIEECCHSDSPIALCLCFQAIRLLTKQTTVDELPLTHIKE